MATGDQRRPLSLSLTRRRALQILGALGGGAILSSCGGATPSPTVPTSPAAPTSPPTSSAGGASAGTVTATARTQAASTAARASATAGLRLPNSGAKLPSEQVNLRWLDNGGAKIAFFNEYFATYQRAHPNITVAYQSLPSVEIAKVVPLGIQNGNAPDVFQLPNTITPSQAVREGWVAPLDDVIPNFASWKAAIPGGVLQPGYTLFDGKVYSFPANGTSKEYATLTLYNSDYLSRAGYDPASKPLTWSEFRAAAKKLTAQGQGQYFGLIIGGKEPPQWEGFVRNLAGMAGATGGDVNWKTGEYNYTSDQYLAAIDLLLSLKADGSIFPGSLSLGFQDAQTRVPAGTAAMILNGPWNIAVWRQDNAEFKFNVGSQPVPDSGAPLPLTYGPNGGTFWLNAKSPAKVVAGDLLGYVGSEDGQVALQTLSGAPRTSVYKAANKVTDERSARIFSLYDQQLRLGPDPVIRTADAAQVALEQRSLKPSFGETIQGIYTGQLKDVKAAMQDLQDRSEAELQRAIKAAQGKGAKVSRDDWKFANWDPTKDYTADDYKAL